MSEWGIAKRNEGHHWEVGNQGDYDGNQGGNDGNAKNQGGNAGNQVRNDGNMGNQGENVGIRVEMRRIWVRIFVFIAFMGSCSTISHTFFALSTKLLSSPSRRWGRWVSPRFHLVIFVFGVKQEN